MTFRALVVASGAASVAALIVAACVGNDPVTTSGVQPDPNAKPGEFRGRCDNGRCLTGLRCDTAIDICVPEGDGGTADEGGASSSGGSSGGASSSGGSSGGGSSSGSTGIACPYDAGQTTEKPCLYDNAFCTSAPVCCLYSSQSNCQQNGSLCVNMNLGKPIACVGDTNCLAGHSCCLSALKPLDAGGCNTLNVAELGQAYCHDAGSCPNGQNHVCRNDGECQTGKCVKLTISGSVGSVELGTCR